MSGIESLQEADESGEKWRQYFDAKHERGRELVGRLAQALDPNAPETEKVELRDLMDDILYESSSYVMVGSHDTSEMKLRVIGAHQLLDWLVSDADTRALGDMRTLLADAEARSIPKPEGV